MNQEFVPGPLIRDDDEGLFSRDIDGQLVRLDEPTAADYEKTVTLQIDGQSVTVPLAAPLHDSQGNIVQDVDGRTTPRYTTIYNAAVSLYVKQPGDEAKIPIPTLCHLEHMTPVAICRLCVVQIYGTKRGKRAAERKLLPACQHPVKDGMEVFTMNAPGPDGERVRQSVKILTELLASDHLKPAQPPALEREFAPFNELAQAVQRSGAAPDRLKLDVLSGAPPVPPPRVGRRVSDGSSAVFQVDHSACILCERCVRGCDEIRKNDVIGRTGKGVTAGISFDLNDPMGRSSCVQCGECMVSCPTSAIMFKPAALVKVGAENRSRQFLPPAELLSDPLFARISPKFLLWQQGMVVRRAFKAGEVLCRQGDAGNTAFLVKSGKLEITVAAQTPPPKTALGMLIPHAKTKTVARYEWKPEALIVGEMACMTATPRTATVTALTAGVVWEIRRNVLDRLMRVPNLRQLFEGTYRDRVLSLTLRNSELFRELDPGIFERIIDYLRPRITFARVTPGQPLFEQGDVANALYFVRIGHVRIGRRLFGAEAKVVSVGPGTVLGEIGLLGLTEQDLRQTPAEVTVALQKALEQASGEVGEAIPAGLRTSTCSALGHLELARLSREHFLEMLREFPLLTARLVGLAFTRLRGKKLGSDSLDDYVEQGLYEGGSILVLDLDRCTRCDLCTRGCIDKHGYESHGTGVSRLLREGVRFGNYVVATSCRSCTDAHCMVGCPVDSIHRGRHQQIVIEDHCIGCGMCAKNCPYGSISMLPNEHKLIQAPDPAHPGGALLIGQPKAAVCDLCDAAGELSSPHPQCVASCPHDAAFRMTGPDLLERVLRSS
jgi:CRP-like cAMP-binding protein/Fe-S-cluster-containing dehydrogenase component